MRQPSASLRNATVKIAPVCVTAAYSEAHGRGNDYISAIAGNIDMTRFVHGDEIV